MRAQNHLPPHILLCGMNNFYLFAILASFCYRQQYAFSSDKPSGPEQRGMLRDVSAAHWQSHQPLLHKVMGRSQQSQTRESPFQQTFFEWFQALGKKKLPIYYGAVTASGLIMLCF